jgi:hypothetical protein
MADYPKSGREGARPSGKGSWDTTGSQHMHKWSGTGTQESGQSAQEGTGSKRGIAPKTGSEHGFYSDNEKSGKTMSAKPGANTDYAGTASDGTSSPTKKGGDQRFAAGGTTHMYSNRGSLPAKGGCSAP